MSTYTVQPGDTLASVARALLGSVGRWRELQLYNLALLKDPANFGPGMVLRLPPGAAIPARSASSSKPTRSREGRVRAVARSWKRPQTP